MQNERPNTASQAGTTCDADASVNFVYVLRCNDDSLYTGWTNRLDKRLKSHQDGSGAKYTRARKPLELMCLWQFPSAKEARRFEILFKRLSRTEKLAKVEVQRSLIDFNLFNSFLSNSALGKALLSDSP